MTYRFLRFGVTAFASVLLACTDSTAPNEQNLLGCHLLRTSALSNGASASSMVVLLRRDSVDVLSSENGTPSSGLSRGSWRLEEPEKLMMWFGGGFVGVNYTFDVRRNNSWFGTVLFWLDHPGGGEGSAVLSPIALHVAPAVCRSALADSRAEE